MLLDDQIKFFKYKKYTDKRGYMSVVMDSSYQLPFIPVQINESFAKKMTLKGIHYSGNMAKLIRVISGKILELTIDMRKKSSNFLKCNVYELTNNDQWIYIPKGFGNGMYYLEDSIIEYIFNIEYNNSEQIVINIFDKDIEWKTKIDFIQSNIIQSDKDKNGISIQNWQNLTRNYN